MQLFLHLLRTDARRLFKTPSVPLLWLAFPLALSLIEYGAFGQVGRSASGLPKGTLLLVDHDRSMLSGVFAQALSREPLAGFFDVVRLDTTKVFEKKLANNDGSAALLLPHGFQDSILAGARVGLAYVPAADPSGDDRCVAAHVPGNRQPIPARSPGRHRARSLPDAGRRRAESCRGAVDQRRVL